MPKSRRATSPAAPLTPTAPNPWSDTLTNLQTLNQRLTEIAARLPNPGDALSRNMAYSRAMLRERIRGTVAALGLTWNLITNWTKNLCAEMEWRDKLLAASSVLSDQLAEAHESMPLA